MERVSGMGGSPEGQRSPGRLGILQEGNLKAQEHAVPICQKTSWRGSRLAWLKKEVWLELKKKKRLRHLEEMAGNPGGLQGFCEVMERDNQKGQSPRRT